MKVVILAGGLGTRISEETHVKPKPMVEIGGMPILWHIMKIYSGYGYNDFIICVGYKGYYIKDWFYSYFMHNSDFTIDMQNNTIEYHKTESEKWKVTLVDTGSDTLTGGRIARIKDYVKDETFMMTYGDGVSDIDIGKLVSFHKSKDTIATVTVVSPEGRFGVVDISEDSKITSFSEKTDNKNRVNGGFFILGPKIFDYIKEGDSTIFEKAPLENLSKDGQLSAYQHDGFWKPMDTLSDKYKLEALWDGGKAPWKKW